MMDDEMTGVEALQYAAQYIDSPALSGAVSKQANLLEKFQGLANIALEWSKRTESDERSHGGAVAIATKLAALADEQGEKS